LKEDRRALVTRALGRDRAAVRELCDVLAPVTQARVARMAGRGHQRTAAQVRQMAEDLTQEVFVALFQDDGRALRAWAPERGLSLESYVGLLAEHQAASILRSGRRSAWREDATEDATLAERAGLASEGAAQVVARDTLVRLLDRVRASLSPLGLQLFEMLIVEERAVPDVCSTMGMSADAVYAWRSRLGKLVAKTMAELEAARTVSAGMSNSDAMPRKDPERGAR
jgi:DNA-directed RNA polymerase specialized sigma24 family protein